MNNHDHHHAPANGSPDELAICPVMRMPVNKEEAKAHGLTRTYKDQTYYLCCNSCVSAFDKDPQKYAKEQEAGDSQGMDQGGHDHHAHMMTNSMMSWWQRVKM